jgi:hypothetical protein
VGTSTIASPAANTNVSGNSLHRRFFTATAMYDGARKTMQQGANRATPPAKNAARTDPVVSRSPTAQPALAVAEELTVHQDQRAHRRPVYLHQPLPDPTVHVDGLHDHLVRARQIGEGPVRVLTEVAGLALHDRDSGRRDGRRVAWHGLSSGARVAVCTTSVDGAHDDPARSVKFC